VAGEQGIEERRLALSETKRELLRARLQGRGRATNDLAPARIPKRPPGSPAVLSFAQQRLWFLDQLVPGSPFYTESSGLRIQAAIIVPAFRRALNEIVRRHEVLRTVFPLIDGEPTAAVQEELEIQLPVLDLTDRPAARKDVEVIRIATEEAQRSFDLATGPLLRTSLLQLGSTDWVFLLSMHHIVCDGWSSTVFAKELSDIYSAFVAGKPSPLPELPIQYGDFAHWQRSWLVGGVLESQLAYWRSQLVDLPQLELPTDRPRPAIFTYRGSHHKFRLPAGVTTALEKLARSEGATLFMCLIAGFKTLLHRYTNQDEIVVGVPVANRNRRELEPLIGFFVNVLVMRNNFSGVPTHREVLRRVRTTALDAYANQDLPFEKLVEDLQPERDLARNPLFQVIFQLHDNPASGRHGSAAALPLVEVDRATVKFDLRVDFFQYAEGLDCTIEYSSDLFTAERIVRMSQHLATVYDAMARNPDQSVGDFELVTADERATLVRWGNAQCTTPTRPTIDKQFEEQAAATPDAIALVTEDRKLTYAEVDAAADLLAGELIARDIRPGELVALPAEAGIESIIALLAILKANGAYLPLNLGYPDERLGYMLRDAGARLLVGRSVDQLQDRFGLEWIASGPLHDQKQIARKPSLNTPDSLAYVVYTSGSTGIPKGVCVTHRAVMRLITDHGFCSMSPTETFLLLAPMTFDASTLEVWAPLLNGGRLAIYSKDRLSPSDLERAIQQFGVTTIWLTAGVFHEIADSCPEALAGVRQLLSGGDVLSPGHVRAHLARYPHCRVVNGYGPTENTTFTACYVINDSTNLDGMVPIGRPINGTYIHVADRYGQLAAIGVPGELLAGGDGLARCYLNDASLTADRFVPDPFCDRSVSPRRLYRTGDRVCFLPDGNLEFLGRMDRQIKIRGFRVEPGEIEEALLKHPEVQNAVVIPCDGQTGSKRLTAFVVTKEPEGVQSGSDQSRAVETLTGHWRTLYEDLYANRIDSADASFDITGWRASGTGAAIPAHEMREWVDGALERIWQNRPQRVLEIGCGTGLLTWRLAPLVRWYTGTDFSSVVIERLGKDLGKAGFDTTGVRLAVQEATDLTVVEKRSVDAVVINSVVQYFPGVDYLMEVIAGAIEAADAGAVIFIGDVRSLPHLAVFHTGLHYARAESDIPATEIRQRVGKSIQLEQELVIDPAFFDHLPKRFSRITHVDVQWKRGSANNELILYRYDVMLFIEGRHQCATRSFDLDWEEDHLTVSAVRDRLLSATADMVTVRSVPNRRLVGPVRGWCQLWETDDLRKSPQYVTDHLEDSSVPPLDEFWSLADGTGYVAHVRPGGAESPETCIVRYVRRMENGSRPYTWLADELGSRNLRHYVTDPLKLLIAERLSPVLREFLKEQLPEYMMPSAFTVLDAFPLTRNGKIDRAALARLTTESPPASKSFVATRDEIERRLAEIWSRVLRVERVGINDNFFELGGDSILCIQVISRAKAESIQITIKQMFENQTIARLAAVATESGALKTAEAPAEGSTGLTPAQAWLLEQQLPNVHHFNQSILLEVPPELNAAVLDRALRETARQHSAFRLRFARNGGQWQASYVSFEDRPLLERCDLSRVDHTRRTSELERHCASVQAGLNVTSGPIFRAVLYDFGFSRSARLLLAAHHLMVDGVSWRILLEDLWAAYTDIASGREPVLPQTSTSLHYWAARLKEFADSADLLSQRDYWLSVCALKPPALPVDREGPNTVGCVQLVTEELDEADTEAVLTAVPRAFRTQVNDVLLTAFGRSLATWTGSSEIWFDLEGHGREPLFDDVDLSRTVGWFTSIFPVRLQVDPFASAVASLLGVQEQLESIPQKGVGFGILRFLSTDPEVRKLRAISKPQITFNYLGQFGGNDSTSTIRGASESQGELRDPNGNREYLIEVDGTVAYNRLRFDWSYSGTHYNSATIEGLARKMMDELRSIVTERRQGGQRRLTPEDFPAAGIDHDDLQRLLSSLQELNESE
jgi:amino acid adenylation domain-containing protein/non-ribosomal peptide synthase protein (TIGR01720 family)